MSILLRDKGNKYTLLSTKLLVPAEFNSMNIEHTDSMFRLSINTAESRRIVSSLSKLIEDKPKGEFKVARVVVPEKITEKIETLYKKENESEEKIRSSLKSETIETVIINPGIFNSKERLSNISDLRTKERWGIGTVDNILTGNDEFLIPLTGNMEFFEEQWLYNLQKRIYTRQRSLMHFTNRLADPNYFNIENWNTVEYNSTDSITFDSDAKPSVIHIEDENNINSITCQLYIRGVPIPYRKTKLSNTTATFVFPEYLFKYIEEYNSIESVRIIGVSESSKIKVNNYFFKDTNFESKIGLRMSNTNLINHIDRNIIKNEEAS